MHQRLAHVRGRDPEGLAQRFCKPLCIQEIPEFLSSSFPKLVSAGDQDALNSPNLLFANATTFFSSRK